MIRYNRMISFIAKCIDILKNIEWSLFFRAGVTHGVRWMNGSKTLSQMEFIKANSRFRIDHLNRLYIENVQFYDSRNYTCWFENKQIAVVIVKGG